MGHILVFFPDVYVLVVFRERICKISTDKLAYCFRPSGGMADAGDLKSPARNGRVGSNPTSAIIRRARCVLLTGCKAKTFRLAVAGRRYIGVR